MDIYGVIGILTLETIKKNNLPVLNGNRSVILSKHGSRLLQNPHKCSIDNIKMRSAKTVKELFVDNYYDSDGDALQQFKLKQVSGYMIWHAENGYVPIGNTITSYKDFYIIAMSDHGDDILTTDFTMVIFGMIGVEDLIMLYFQINSRIICPQLLLIVIML